MHRYLIFVFSIVLFTQYASAQDLFTPRDVQQAFKKGTRSTDGKPGRNYWQNHGRYVITITAAPPERIIKGTETIIYFNNSPDTIRAPSIKLFLNIHKPGAPRNGGASPDYLTSGVHVDKFAVNNQVKPFRDDPRVFTNVSVRLPQPLLPHDSVH